MNLKLELSSNGNIISMFRQRYSFSETENSVVELLELLYVLDNFVVL